MRSSSSTLFCVFAFSLLYLVAFGCHPNPRRNPTPAVTTTTATPPDQATLPPNDTAQAPNGTEIAFTMDVHPHISWTWPTKDPANGGKPVGDQKASKEEAQKALDDYKEMQVNAAIKEAIIKDNEITVELTSTTPPIQVDISANDDMCDAGKAIFHVKTKVITGNCVAGEDDAANTITPYALVTVKGTFKSKKALEDTSFNAFVDALETAFKKDGILPADGSIKAVDE